MNNDFVLSKLNEHFNTDNHQVGAIKLINPEHGDTYFLIEAKDLIKICEFLKNDEDLWFNFLKLITAVDRGTIFSSTYHLYSYKYEFGITLRVDIDKAHPVVDSICCLWPGANWLERECYDLMGIIYNGHPGLRRILLPLDWQGYPLRKNYIAPSEYNGIKN